MDKEKVKRGLHQHCEGSMFDRCGECPYYEIDHEPFVCRDMLLNDLNELLKEQEPKTGHWIFESAYCEAWSHTCSECGKRMTTAYNTYANYCWNCGSKMEGR